jgi:hypothetical protein
MELHSPEGAGETSLANTGPFVGPASVPAPGSALGLLLSRALSSAQAKAIVSKRGEEKKAGAKKFDAPHLGWLSEQEYRQPFNGISVELRREATLNIDKYIGMDVHQATTVVVLDAEGRVVLERSWRRRRGPHHPVVARLGRVSSGSRLRRPHAGGLASRCDPALGDGSGVVCDPRRNKLLQEGSKADEPDAKKLAELLRAGLATFGVSRTRRGPGH